MKSSTDCYLLSNGVSIPCIGFGTWQTHNGEIAVSAVKTALDAGYRHIDTAALYGNEESIGTAVLSSGIPRQEIFITSKLANPVRGYSETIAAFNESIKKLKTDYLDLYLIHWPNPIKYRSTWKESNAESWRAFEDLYSDGKIKAIGISNFHPHHIDALMETAKITPMVNQIRLCPGDTQDKVVGYSRKMSMLLEAYTPLGRGVGLDLPEAISIAQKYNKSVAQICMRWSLQMGFLPLPKSITPSRIRENIQVFDFKLSAEDVAALSDMTGKFGLSVDPDSISF